MNDDRRIRSEATFVSAIVFLGLLFWTYHSWNSAENPKVFYLMIAQMAIYGILAISSAAYGTYLIKTGKGTIKLPSTKQIIFSFALIMLIWVAGIIVLVYRGAQIQ